MELLFFMVNPRLQKPLICSVIESRPKPAYFNWQLINTLSSRLLRQLLKTRATKTLALLLEGEAIKMRVTRHSISQVLMCVKIKLETSACTCSKPLLTHLSHRFVRDMCAHLTIISKMSIRIPSLNYQVNSLIIQMKQFR